jgi:hypothetical protein
MNETEQVLIEKMLHAKAKGESETVHRLLMRIRRIDTVSGDEISSKWEKESPREHVKIKSQLELDEERKERDSRLWTRKFKKGLT